MTVGPLAMASGAPPLPPLTPVHKPAPVRRLITMLLNLCLAFFLADAVISFVDDALIVCLGLHVLGAIRGMLFLAAALFAIGTFVLMGLTPMIPKRVFLPVTLYNPAAALAAIPLLIFFHDRIQQVALVLSAGQVIFGLLILHRLQGGFKFRWPLVTEGQLNVRDFSWRNLVLFPLANVFLLLPAVAVYLAVCASVAVDHFSEGFLALRPEGLSSQGRNYVRSDGKSIQLIPMSHVGDPDFYRKLSQSFPSNAVILMEGVTDNRHLLTNKISYNRMAKSLGVAEQAMEFKPQGEMVRADVDMDQFNTNTINFLNLVMLIHADGLNAGSFLKLSQHPPPPGFEVQLFDDLLHQRNRHLLKEINTRLAQSNLLIVPWGAAHMPELAREIQKAGFRLDSTEEYMVLRFRGQGIRADEPK